MSTTPYAAGQAVRLPCQLVDPVSGTPVDPETLSLTIRLPDGSTVTANLVDLTRLGVGSYEYVYTPPNEGRYAYWYRATAPNGGLDGEFTALPSGAYADSGQVFGWPGSYVTIAEFRAMPTGTNVDDLIANGSLAANDAELGNILLRASRWCDNYCAVQLGAHRVLSERQSVRVAGDGTITLSPRHTSGTVPAVSLSRLAYGSPGQMTDSTPAVYWPADGLIVVPFTGGGGTVPLQFGGPPPGQRMWVEYDYIAGFPISILTAASAAAATTLAIQDATGIQPGQTLNIHHPGSEEAVSVATSWTPTTGPATLPLVGTAAYAHPAGTSIGAMPEDIKTAVGQMAVVLIRRSSDTGAPSVDKSVGTDMDVFQKAARMILDRYKRIAV